ncbi:MAG TPA: prenyltransferase/squalene oxidase repeat-containing protein [archaeon]|nr:prenyltransferase/squalene oxidase repeat-containing protein [archaeon]
MNRLTLNYLFSLFLLVLLLGGCKEPGPVVQVPEEAAAIHPTVQWILACRQGQGGFGCFPGDSAFTSRTGMALEALADLGGLESLAGKDSLISWLSAHQQDDGGFYEAASFYGEGKLLPWGTNSALEPTFWAVRAFKLLGIDPPQPEKTARFIAARQLQSGAFEAYEYAEKAVPEAVYTTFWAVAALKDLALPVPDSGAVVEWTRHQQDTDGRRGGFALQPDNFYYSSAQGTYYAVRTLALLGAKPKRPQAVKRFLLSSYGQEPDGGFEVGHGDNWNNYDHYSRMQDTYAAVYTLELLCTPLSDTDTSRAARPAADCERWIAGVQNPDGGFARLGVTDQTPVPSPSEMRATWQAVRALTLLGRPVPRPENPIPPQEKIEIRQVRHKHPVVNHNDPLDVWAYRRIAAPIYYHYLEVTGSQMKAIGMLSRWVRAAVGPENQAGGRQSMGRRFLMHGWGQCGTMSHLLQALATSVDHASRGAFAWGDANAEVLLQEKEWDAPHWVCYIPFTNEYVDPGLPTPEGTRNGWSALDLVIDYGQRIKNLNYISKTRLGDNRYWRVWLQTVNDTTGLEGAEFKIDTTASYDSELARTVYPGGSW